MIGTATALILPWLFGCTSLLWLVRRSRQWNFPIIAGHGYLVGMMLTTLVIRLWNLVGLPLNYWGIVAAISVVTIIAAIAAHTVPASARIQVKSPAMKNWQVAIVILLLVMILYRYGVIAQEIQLRPLYPWDAWMNWAPKAIAWFHHNGLVPYVSPGDWLKNADDNLVYTTGAKNAWKYPITIPLIQLWGMLGAGTSDQNFSNLPWLFAPLAFASALYGHLKLMGSSALMATLACYVLLSIPYINVHTALAGYADLWLAFVFGAAVLSLHEWQQSRHWAWATLSLFFAFSCTQLKLPGLVLGSIVLVILLMSLIKPRVGLTLGITAVICLIYAATFGIHASIPAVGLVEISSTRIALPYLGTFNLEYHPVNHALIQNIFYLANWNILWFLFISLLTAKLLSKAFLKPPSLEFLSILLLLLFLFFVFYFTHIHAFVLDYSTVNRAMLYAVPAIVFYIFKNLVAWKKLRPDTDT